MKRKRIAIAVLLMLSIGNFARLKGNENIRVIQFLSIFTIGVLTALLIVSLAASFRNNKLSK